MPHPPPPTPPSPPHPPPLQEGKSQLEVWQLEMAKEMNHLGLDTHVGYKVSVCCGARGECVLWGAW